MADDGKIMDRIAKLLALAEHPNTPAPEAETALFQANKLIVKHAIDEALIRQSMSEGERKAMTSRKIKISEGYMRYSASLRTIALTMASTFRCTAVVLNGEQIHVYGTRDDINWIEQLYTQVHFEFLSKINPKWDTSKSYEENVYNFKVAGYKWLDINSEAVKNGARDARKWTAQQGRINSETQMPYYYGWGTQEVRKVVVERVSESGALWGSWEEPSDKVTGVMIAAYKRHAASIGDDEPVQTQSHDAYRDAWALGFKSRIIRRLDQMAEEASSAYDTIPGAALALSDQTEEQRRMMWADYPEMSPEERERLRNERIIQQRAEEERRQEMLNAMTPKQRNDFLEKEEREEIRNAKRDSRYWAERQDRLSRSGGVYAGAKAAQNIDLSRKAGSASAGATMKEIS